MPVMSFQFVGWCLSDRTGFACLASHRSWTWPAHMLANACLPLDVSGAGRFACLGAHTLAFDTASLVVSVCGHTAPPWLVGVRLSCVLWATLAIGAMTAQLFP